MVKCLTLYLEINQVYGNLEGLFNEDLLWYTDGKVFGSDKVNILGYTDDKVIGTVLENLYGIIM